MLGSYFKGANFEEKVFERLDPGISLNWSGASPVPNFPRENINIRWEGEVAASTTGKVTFINRADDGTRFWFGGQKLIDAWGNLACKQVDRR